jgi:hypothetical protein
MQQPTLQYRYLNNNQCNNYCADLDILLHLNAAPDHQVHNATPDLVHLDA